MFGSGAELRQATAGVLILVFVCEAIALVIGLVVLWQVEGVARDRSAKVLAEPARERG